MSISGNLYKLVGLSIKISQFEKIFAKIGQLFYFIFFFCPYSFQSFQKIEILHGTSLAHGNYFLTYSLCYSTTTLLTLSTHIFNLSSQTIIFRFFIFLKFYFDLSMSIIFFFKKNWILGITLEIFSNDFWIIVVVFLDSMYI